MSLLESLIYGLPWWVQAVAGAALAVPCLLFVVRVAGPANALRLGAVIGACLAALAYGRRERQRGWCDRQNKEERDARHAIESARRARASADGAADAGRLRDDDGFRRN